MKDVKAPSIDRNAISVPSNYCEYVWCGLQCTGGTECHGRLIHLTQSEYIKRYKSDRINPESRDGWCVLTESLIECDADRFERCPYHHDRSEMIIDELERRSDDPYWTMDTADDDVM